MKIPHKEKNCVGMGGGEAGEEGGWCELFTFP